YGRKKGRYFHPKGCLTGLLLKIYCRFLLLVIINYNYFLIFLNKPIPPINTAGANPSSFLPKSSL
ncbi:hypothetical protein, partial [Aerococcus urinaeequi]|uniref:hypothetical protein n=1 Tax=Aerococcus urinaeequi TaxID=51665 RepID=UPI003EC60E33